jgi:3-dehydroquinate synthase
VLERLMRLLAACDLPVCERDLPARVDAGALLGAMEKVRLIRGGGLRWVLPVGLGDTVIADDVGDAEVRAALAIAGVL